MFEEKADKAVKRRILPSVILLLCSVIFSVAAAEAAFRILVHGSLSIDRGEFPVNYFKNDPVSGFDLVRDYPPATHGFENIKYKIWTNELGCFDKPYKGETDYILLAGDSFTWGFTPFERLYGTVIEKHVGLRVLKSGVLAYGTKQELLKIRKMLKSVETPPELIILGYYVGNDLEDDYKFPKHSIINGHLSNINRTLIIDRVTWRKKVLSDKELMSRVKHAPVSGRPGDRPALQRIKDFMNRHSVLYGSMENNTLLRSFASRFGLLAGPVDKSHIPIFCLLDKYPWLSEAWKEHQGTLRKIKQVSDSHGAKLLVVLIPEKVRVYDFLKTPLQREYTSDAFTKELQTFFSGEQINCLDLYPAFKLFADKTPKRYLDPLGDLYWRHDGHWNIKGHNLAGLLIAQYVIGHDLVDISPDEKTRGLEAIDAALDKFAGL